MPARPTNQKQSHATSAIPGETAPAEIVFPRPSSEALADLAELHGVDDLSEIIDHHDGRVIMAGCSCGGTGDAVLTPARARTLAAHLALLADEAERSE